MIVKELIEALTKLDENLQVYSHEPETGLRILIEVVEHVTLDKPYNFFNTEYVLI